MKILAIADEESKYLWDYYEKGKLDDIDLILSAGDLRPEYLSFLETMATKATVLYVHGNHDGKYAYKPPEGCICVDEQLYEYKGIRILGLGGSMCYTGGAHQYTEQEMQKRVVKLLLKIMLKGGFDILLTHAPAYGLNDGEDLPHRGFRIFNRLINRYKPKYFIHGHVHMSYGKKHKRYEKIGETNVINAFERCVFEYEDTEEELKRKLR